MAKITDGIINKELYSKAKYKILWVLKEGNVDEADHDVPRNLCKEINDIDENKGVEQHRKNARAIPTFRKIIYSSYGILDKDKKWLEIPLANEEAYNVFKEIAYININKEPGGAVSDNTEIRKIYERDKKKILEQIEEINPQIIIFGGTEQFLSEKDLKKIGWQSNVKDRFTAQAEDTKYSVTCYSKKTDGKYNDKLIICPVHPACFTVSDKDYCTSIHNAVREWESKHQ